MSIYLILQLSGMLIEIVGTFILSVEAIGLDRFQKWIESLTMIREQLSGKQKSNDSVRKPSAARIIFATICAIGSGFGSWLGTHPPLWAARFPSWVVLLTSIILAGLAGVILFHVILYIMLAVVSALHTVELRTRTRTAGLIGFLLLLVGFVIQFVGTLGQARSV